MSEQYASQQSWKSHYRKIFGDEVLLLANCDVHDISIHWARTAIYGGLVSLSTCGLRQPLSQDLLQLHLVLQVKGSAAAARTAREETSQRSD
jgi:hypothetical protein